MSEAVFCGGGLSKIKRRTSVDLFQGALSKSIVHFPLIPLKKNPNRCKPSRNPISLQIKTGEDHGTEKEVGGGIEGGFIEKQGEEDDAGCV